MGLGVKIRARGLKDRVANFCPTPVASKFQTISHETEPADQKQPWLMGAYQSAKSAE